jgi:hypothetical protein
MITPNVRKVFFCTTWHFKISDHQKHLYTKHIWIYENQTLTPAHTKMCRNQKLYQHISKHVPAHLDVHKYQQPSHKLWIQTSCRQNVGYTHARAKYLYLTAVDVYVWVIKSRTITCTYTMRTYMACYYAFWCVHLDVASTEKHFKCKFRS